MMLKPDPQPSGLDTMVAGEVAEAVKPLLDLARRVAEHFADTDAPLGIAARAAIAEATRQ